MLGAGAEGQQRVCVEKDERVEAYAFGVGISGDDAMMFYNLLLFFFLFFLLILCIT